MVPEHLRDADRKLRELGRRVQLLGALSPTNFGREIARLDTAWESGHPEVPRFEYAPPPDLSQVPDAALAIVRGSEDDPELGALYVERAHELLLEAELIKARETPPFIELARQRFEGHGSVMHEADRLAEAWAAIPDEESEAGAPVRTDDEGDPRSLVCRARTELGKLKLPVRISVVASLAPLAAAGERLLQIAAGRVVRVTDVERTVMHEIHGHLLPMHRATSFASALFEVGSARGSEGQEGYALLLEHRAGFLRGSRARELGQRHIAARAIHAGASFPEVVSLLRARGAPLPSSLRITARAIRGGGLGREAGYLPAYLEVTEAVRRLARLEAVLASGRLSAAAAEALAPFLATSSRA